MKRTLTTLLAAAALLTACRGENKEGAQCQEELTQTKAELLEARDWHEGCEGALGECQRDLGVLAEQLTWERQELTANSSALLCRDDITVSVHKVDSERGWSYLHYTVAGEERQSDALYFSGRTDRGALLIDGQVLLDLESCTESACKARCLTTQEADTP